VYKASTLMKEGKLSMRCAWSTEKLNRKAILAISANSVAIKSNVNTVHRERNRSR